MHTFKLNFKRSKKKSLKHSTKRRKFLLLTSLLLAFIGIYLLTLVLSPEIVSSSQQLSAAATEELISSYRSESINAIIIPSINVDVPILEGDEDVLNVGAWHRKPEQGNPTKDGNFIVTAHRFTLGFSPAQTAEKSPFYNLHKLKTGDDIIIIWNGEKHYYLVEETFEVTPYQLEIEDQTTEKILTLYSCTLQGHLDGRLVIRAKPLG